MSMATILVDLRLKKSKSLQEVADAVGVSKTHIWELEKGRSKNPSVELIKKLADYYSVSVSAIMGENMSDSSDEELISMFRQVGELSKNERAILKDMLESLKKRRG